METATQTQNPGRMARVMASYNGLPTWVKLWMNFILGPVNLATLAFLKEPGAVLIAVLAIGGVAMVVLLVFITGGFNKVVAAGHILPWVPLVLMIAFTNLGGSELYQTFLKVLMVINTISLAFDFNDLRLWLKLRS
ncbi:MAG: hypothetical protein AAF404_03635 [Pseudomonadota bacterium]